MALLLIQTSCEVDNQHLEELKGRQNSQILQPQSECEDGFQTTLINAFPIQRYAHFRSMLCLTAPRKLHKGESGWVQNSKLLLACAERKVASMFHGNMAFPPPACQLYLLCRIQPFTELHFGDCKFIDLTHSPFIYIYLIYRQLWDFSSGLVFIPHMYKTFLYPAHCFCHCLTPANAKTVVLVGNTQSFYPFLLPS